MLTNHTKKLLEEVKQLGRTELQEFVAEVLALSAQRRSPSLSPKESELFTRINRTLSATKRSRLEDLINRQKRQGITEEERTELLALIEEIENLDAQRIEALGELAHLRGVTFPELMKQLGIKAMPIG